MPSVFSEFMTSSFANNAESDPPMINFDKACTEKETAFLKYATFKQSRGSATKGCRSNEINLVDDGDPCCEDRGDQFIFVGHSKIYELG